jgi:hypothetical protein
METDDPCVRAVAQLVDAMEQAFGVLTIALEKGKPSS